MFHSIQFEFGPQSISNDNNPLRHDGNNSQNLHDGKTFPKFMGIITEFYGNNCPNPSDPFSSVVRYCCRDDVPERVR